ncbi:hypothetical protein [Teichococcus rhizosphaerae]|uniref:hypothetical protein n=1 Tax=Teichococcus rhizosphaerae TaxID=1335062 RepID=UPI0011455700|nr:hypothetical protein [Pseudoroseomonas rhizosphaerae]
MSALLQAAARLRQALEREAHAARQVALPELHRLIEEKRQALSALAAAGLPATPEERSAVGMMMRAAEENALVLGSVIGALESIQQRLRQDLSEAANPAVYGPGGGPRRKRLRHTLAASLDRTA